MILGVVCDLVDKECDRNCSVFGVCEWYIIIVISNFYSNT